MKEYSIVIPTLNAGKYIEKLLVSLNSQSIRPNNILVVDSSSNDDTVSIINSLNYDNVVLVEIDRKEFDHGKTRDIAFRSLDDDFVVFMTQDALPANDKCIENLLKPFADDDVAIVTGRQIAYDESTSYEKLVRQFDYPNINRKWNKSDLSKLGINAYYISDVCCAYRRSTYLEVGGFDYPVDANEDMLMAQKLISSGYSIAYNADCKVYHSHDYSFSRQFKRNYEIGRNLEKYKDRLNVSEISKGSLLFKNVSKELIKQHKYLDLIRFLFDCVARFTGNRIGRLSWKINHK